jgi:hypothetical protein
MSEELWQALDEKRKAGLMMLSEWWHDLWW